MKGECMAFRETQRCELSYTQSPPTLPISDVCFLGLWSKASTSDACIPKTQALSWLLTEMLVTKLGFVYL